MGPNNGAIRMTRLLIEVVGLSTFIVIYRLPPTKLIEELVMKFCHENNGAAVYVGRAATLHSPLF